MTGAGGINGNHVFRPRSLGWHDFYINLKDGDDSIENIGMGTVMVVVIKMTMGRIMIVMTKIGPVMAYPTVNHRQYVTTVPQVRHT